MKTAQSKATLAGIRDATAFVHENDAATVAQCLRPGQEGADSSLINELGIEKTAQLFGVAHASPAWSKACEEYNTAWVRTVASLSQE